MFLNNAINLSGMGILYVSHRRTPNVTPGV